MVSLNWSIILMFVFFCSNLPTLQFGCFIKCQETVSSKPQTLPIHFKKLALSTSQLAKTIEIQSKYRHELDALNEKVASLKLELQQDLLKLLSEEQRIKYESLQKNAKTINLGRLTK